MISTCHRWRGAAFPFHAGRSARAPAARQGGYTYLLVLFLVGALGLLAAQVGVVWQQAAQRDREADLIAMGVEMARGLVSYKKASQQKVFPAKLTDMLEDKRFPGVVRHLRRVYRDPFTKQTEWGLQIQNGQIIGIYSLATGEPIRRDGLPPELGDAAKSARTYAEWVFKPIETTTGQGPSGSDDEVPAQAAPGSAAPDAPPPGGAAPGAPSGVGGGE